MTATTNYPDNITALYARLSQEDALDGESSSIANHVLMILLSLTMIYPFVWAILSSFKTSEQL